MSGMHSSEEVGGGVPKCHSRAPRRLNWELYNVHWRDVQCTFERRTLIERYTEVQSNLSEVP